MPRRKSPVVLVFGRTLVLDVACASEKVWCSAVAEVRPLHGENNEAAPGPVDDGCDGKIGCGCDGETSNAKPCERRRRSATVCKVIVIIMRLGSLVEGVVPMWRTSGGRCRTIERGHVVSPMLMFSGRIHSS